MKLFYFFSELTVQPMTQVVLMWMFEGSKILSILKFDNLGLGVDAMM